MVTDGHAVTHVHLGIDLDILADGHAVANVGKCAHIYIIGQGSALAHMDGLLNAAFLGTLAVHKVQQVCQCLVGVVNADECRLDLLLGLEVLVDQHSRGLGRVDEMRVFGIGQERQAAWCCLFYLCIVVNHRRCVTIDRAVNHCCKLLCSNFH